MQRPSVLCFMRLLRVAGPVLATIRCILMANSEMRGKAVHNGFSNVIANESHRYAQINACKGGIHLPNYASSENLFPTTNKKASLWTSRQLLSLGDPVISQILVQSISWAASVSSP